MVVDQAELGFLLSLHHVLLLFLELLLVGRVLTDRVSFHDLTIFVLMFIFIIVLFLVLVNILLFFGLPIASFNPALIFI